MVSFWSISVNGDLAYLRKGGICSDANSDVLGVRGFDMNQSLISERDYIFTLYYSL